MNEKQALAGIRLSIEEMLSADTIEGIGANHKDTGVAIVRVLGYVRKLEEENETLRRTLGGASARITGTNVTGSLIRLSETQNTA